MHQLQPVGLRSAQRAFVRKHLAGGEWSETHGGQYAAALANGKARWLERATSEGPIRRLLQQAKRRTRRLLLNENKWRAARHGITGKLIDFGKQEEVPCVDLIHELLAFIDDVVDELGSREEINYIHQILRAGTGADRQLQVWEQTQDVHEVVNFIVRETHHGLDLA